MSYNIDSVSTLVLDAYMLAKDVRRLYQKYDGGMAEIHFLEDMEGPAETALAAGDPDRKIPLKGLQWYGEGSGNSYDETLPKIAKKIMGTVEAIFTWEGGDAVSGVRIEDGVFEEVEVTQTLAPKAGAKRKKKKK